VVKCEGEGDRTSRSTGLNTGTGEKMENDSHLATIREIEKNGLSPFPPGIQDDGPSHMFEMKEGSCEAWCLFENDGQVGVHRWFNTAGTKFPEHAHKEKEWLFIYQGMMHLQRPDGVFNLGPGSMIKNDPGVPHSAVFSVDTYYFTIMFPKAEEFPHYGTSG
jgi:quercetin dioxygenase-like cupin family protein